MFIKAQSSIGTLEMLVLRRRHQSSDFTFFFNFVTLVKNIKFKLFTLKTNGLDD